MVAMDGVSMTMTMKIMAMVNGGVTEVEAESQERASQERVAEIVATMNGGAVVESPERASQARAVGSLANSSVENSGVESFHNNHGMSSRALPRKKELLHSVS